MRGFFSQRSIQRQLCPSLSCPRAQPPLPAPAERAGSSQARFRSKLRKPFRAGCCAEPQNCPHLWARTGMCPPAATAHFAALLGSLCSSRTAPQPLFSSTRVAKRDRGGPCEAPPAPLSLSPWRWVRWKRGGAAPGGAQRPPSALAPRRAPPGQAAGAGTRTSTTPGGGGAPSPSPGKGGRHPRPRGAGALAAAGCSAPAGARGRGHLH